MYHVITFCHRVEKYPPIIATVNALSAKGEIVYVLGDCREDSILKDWESKGVKYINFIHNDEESNNLVKLYRYVKYKILVKNFIKNTFNKNNALIWVFGENNIWLLNGIFSDFRCIAYLFETPSFEVPISYRLVSNSFSYSHTLMRAYKVVCCEYHRAAITKAYFGLKDMPSVMENKTFANVGCPYPPKKSIENLLGKIKEKKVLLYQGIFNSPERQLEEYCQALMYLPQDYVLVFIGGGGNFDSMREKYEGPRIFFHDFVPFPEYLSITSVAHIGLLSYFSSSQNIGSVLNTLFCAPNKIFEYTGMGVPFVSNDLPAIASLIDKFKCGEIVAKFEPKEIANSIINLSLHHDQYVIAAKKFYASVDFDVKIYELIGEVKF